MVDLLTPPTGRLTLTSGVGITSADVMGATTVYHTGAVSVPIYNGVVWVPYQIGELSVPLDAAPSHSGYHAAGHNFDFFDFLNCGVPACGTGPAWISDTSRGTGDGTTELQNLNGIWTNKNIIVLRFGKNPGDVASVPPNQATWIGSQRMIADGQACDTARQRFLFNAYSPARRPLRVSEPGDTWGWSQSSFHQVNANSLNQVEVLLGMGGVSVELRAHSAVANTSNNPQLTATGIGVDSVTISSADLWTFTDWTSGSLGGVKSVVAEYNDFPGLGFHALAWLEAGGGTGDRQAWYGTNNGARPYLKTGLSGGYLG